MVIQRRLAVVATVLALALVIDGYRRAQQPPVPAAAAQVSEIAAAAPPCDWSRTSRGLLPMSAGVPAAHSSSLLVLPLSH